MARLNRLHLGAGSYFWPTFDNLDEESDLKDLDYENESVDSIYAIHLFEHLPRPEINSFLQEWKRVLVSRGTLVMEMPSLDKIAQLIVAGETNERLTVLGLLGDPRDWDNYPLMRHNWAWTNRELKEVLTENGFEVEFANPVYHIQQRDLRVIARKL